MTDYTGRFAPSPTGPLHFGSVVCAAATYLDARAHEGVWLVRIEDIDPPRDVPGADREILRVLSALGMVSDKPVVWQSERYELYTEAFNRLVEDKLVYGCACTRAEIQAKNALLNLPAHVYPGTCRNGTDGRPPRSWRFRVDSRPISFVDRISGFYEQNVEKTVGDFVVKRADGLWAYQLAVVVDDHEQGVTDIVRGADLLDNTPRQIALQSALNYSHPRYMHIALVTDDNGCKLSKQNGAKAVTVENPLAVLEAAWEFLGFQKLGAESVESFWKTATPLWKNRYALKSNQSECVRRNPFGCHRTLPEVCPRRSC